MLCSTSSFVVKLLVGDMRINTHIEYYVCVYWLADTLLAHLWDYIIKFTSVFWSPRRSISYCMPRVYLGTIVICTHTPVDCLRGTCMTYEWCELSGKDIWHMNGVNCLGRTYDIWMVWIVWEGHMTYEWCELSGRDIQYDIWMVWTVCELWTLSASWSLFRLKSSVFPLRIYVVNLINY